MLRLEKAPMNTQEYGNIVMFNTSTRCFRRLEAEECTVTEFPILCKKTSTSYRNLELDLVKTSGNRIFIKVQNWGNQFSKNVETDGNIPLMKKEIVAICRLFPLKLTFWERVKTVLGYTI